MKIYFFSIGGKRFGFGHIARCLPIYDELTRRGKQCIFIINGDNSLTGLIGARNFQYLDWQKKGDIVDLERDDIVIIDTLNYPFEFVSGLPGSINHYFISDNFYKDPLPSYIINWGVNSKSRKNQENGLFGEEFVPLRSEILKFRKLKVINKSVEKIVVSVGSADVLNIIPVILSEILKNFKDNVQIYVVAGANNGKIKTYYTEFPENVHFLVSPKSDKLFEIISEADFAVASGGHSMYEFAYLKTPVVHVLVVDNQYPALEWNRTGFTFPIGWYEESTFAEKLKKGIKYFSDANNIRKAADIGERMVDGKGSVRIVDYILSHTNE